MNRRIILLFIYIYINTLVSYGQTPKTEFRGVWVATVANIDWPSKPGLHSNEQKQEIINILDYHKSHHANAIILQVRPTADALYPSDIEPWSKYLSGEQGKAPEPFYDPLEFWIQESHKRGMELHAWFNPYRIKQKLSDSLSNNHIINKHPDWGWEYGNRLYFEPGHPEVWNYVSKVVSDVVSRYDIDAVHFDDYFYPYKVKDQAFPDSTAFKKYGGNFYPNHLDDWRRHNTDTIIQILSHAIKTSKPWVKFGISPFGVWRNRSTDPIGSESKAGTTNYDHLYADVIKWQREGWIDYLMPQLYWRESHPAVGFSTLAHWWNDNNFGRSMYIGLAPYRIDKKSKHKLWRKEKHFLAMINKLRELQGIDGFGYFSSKSIINNQKLLKKLAQSQTKYPAIVPPMPWIDNKAPSIPFNLTITNGQLTWNSKDSDNEFEKSRFFVVYKYDLDSKKQLNDVKNIYTITGQQQIPASDQLPKGIYRISALDRLNNESQLSEPIKILE